MLKTTGLSRLLVSKIFKADNNEFIKSKVDETVVDLFQSKKSKNIKSKNKMHIRTTGFLTFKAKMAFIQ